MGPFLSGSLAVWLPVGLVWVSGTTGETTVGRVAATVLGGVLHLRASTLGANPDPLSFLIFDFLSTDGERSLGSEKWWPRAEPAAVRLGPGVTDTIDGRVLLQPRGYNRQWLRVGHPSRTLPILVEAFTASGTTLPRFLPSGVVAGDGVYRAATGSPGSDGPHPLELIDV